MVLCLDVGNTTIYGGLFLSTGDLAFSFRHTTRSRSSSDEYGLFLRSVLRENGFNPDEVRQVAISSVVPDLLYSLTSCSVKYFRTDPFILKPGVKTGLGIRYRNPQEVGADRIANAIAATERFPESNIIIVDFGTATTFCVVSKTHEYLGGIITLGVGVSMEALEERTAKLPRVEILRPPGVVGRTTVEGIQSGLYFGTVSMVRGLTNAIIEEHFAGDPPVVIGTGGFARLFEREQLFTTILPDLVLRGLFRAYKINSSPEQRG